MSRADELRPDVEGHLGIRVTDDSLTCNFGAARRIIQELESAVEGGILVATKLNEHINTLEAERDEARKLAMELVNKDQLERFSEKWGIPVEHLEEKAS